MRREQRWTVIVAMWFLLLAGVSAGHAQDAPFVVSPRVLLESAIQFDPVAETITLPLFEGRNALDQEAWFVVLDASDRESARTLGVNFSPKLENALGTPAVQPVSWENGIVRFAGDVDFTPVHEVVPNPVTGFPPDVAVPGSVGDARYSPLITAGDGIVLNAPIVANSTGMHDKVAEIDFIEKRVTLLLTRGFYHGKGILYLSTDASDPVAAALEESTYAPNMDAAPAAGSGDPLISARAAIVALVNGETGTDNPERQGLHSAVLGEGSPLNVTEIHPRNRARTPTYSPLWDVHPAVWTDAAIELGMRSQIRHHRDVGRGLRAGLLASGGSGPQNPDLAGLRAAGFIVNCPIMVVE